VHVSQRCCAEAKPNLKIDADAGVAFVSVLQYIYIYQRQRKQNACKCACVYGICSVKNKIENETNLTDSTSNLT
jgi:hypothetical protein